MASAIGGCVILETSLGNMTLDLYTEDCPLATLNFLKLCKLKYFNGCPFHSVVKDFIVQTGRVGMDGGTSIYGLMQGKQLKFFNDELSNQRRKRNRVKHNRKGIVAMANLDKPNTNASQFYITATDTPLDHLDDRHTIFGEVSEGFDVLEKINTAFTDDEGIPLKPIRIKHTVVVSDPFDDPRQMAPLLRASPPLDRYIDDDGYVSSELDSGDDADEEALAEKLALQNKKTAEVALEVLEDIPDADLRPPENVLFVCKLNPVTRDEDLETIFSRFGTIVKCEVIRDKKTGDSLQYAFIEYEDEAACNRAYLKMENVLIDDRRIHVDFSQSVAKLWRNYKGVNRKRLRTPGSDDEEGLAAQLPGQLPSRIGNLKIKRAHRTQDRALVFDDGLQMRTAFSLIAKERKDAKRKKESPNAARNVYGDEEWSDEGEK
eukprot:TRINITY_DN3475_c0_g1_i1.p1 TRINITY_DN3475_c0_g1~~TRINITY_DN3475_c0_g1_i1.p1  ORF type:complete len:440 (-),score=112.05 TRINITY_DN3475_c0_g1_i1:67-1362(-)